MYSGRGLGVVTITFHYSQGELRPAGTCLTLVEAFPAKQIDFVLCRAILLLKSLSGAVACMRRPILCEIWTFQTCSRRKNASSRRIRGRSVHRPGYLGKSDQRSTFRGPRPAIPTPVSMKRRKRLQARNTQRWHQGPGRACRQTI